MQRNKHITVLSDRKKVVLSVDRILYVRMFGRIAEIHTSDGQVYETRMKMAELEELLADGFIKIHRGCLVSVKAIHDITDKINLSNGETLFYTSRKKKQIIEQFHAKQELLVRSFRTGAAPQTAEEYRAHYSCFDSLPVAFTDIELVFDENKQAVDWIFRYANSALAELEKIPLEKLINKSFGTLFSNMDSKWLRSYERATLYGETLEIVDYSPEIDTHLKIICFPTFSGHCGCILFDVSKINFNSSSGAEKMLIFYLNE